MSPRRHSARLLVACAATAATLLTCAAAGASEAGSAAAATEPTVEALRAEADAIATQYFAALVRSQDLDTEITRNEALVVDLEEKAATARLHARERAQVAYRHAGSELAAVVDGGDVLDAARRAHFIDQVNERDQATFAHLRDVSQDLREQRRSLEATRIAQAETVHELTEQGAAMDAKLTEASRREAAQREAAQRAAAQRAAAAAPATSPAAPAVAPAPAAPAGAPAPAAPPATTAAPPKIPAPPPPPSYSGTPGMHPRHDDPFLVCVRLRESGGNYGAVNRAGPFLGAYQFLQATWNGAANHARRAELVGVPVNNASPYDQDDMAWALYQWQGAGPWGGGCT